MSASGDVRSDVPSGEGAAGERLGTLCVHGGRSAPAAGEPLVGPLVRSVTFRLDDEAYALRAAGRSREARIYARETSPSVESLERRLAALEGAPRALAFASGMAALHALVLALLERGDHAVVSRDVYGGTAALVRELAPRLGVDVTAARPTADDVRAALRPTTRAVFCESISNPTLEVADVPALAAVARAAGARLVVDATFATPILQRPLELGADAVMHSATKFLGGHGDVVAGVVCGGEELVERCWTWRTRAGACLDPEAAWLVERSLATLALRVRAQSDGAAAVAAFLARHPRVERVHHPSLDTHPTAAVARRVLAGGGGMVSFVARGGDAAALALVRRLRLFQEAASLGGVESLASLPHNMSHVGLDERERAERGIAPGLVRLSIGLEDPRDLVDDLRSALDAA